ncbi:MAG TPA: energy transducer TonB [Bryobacteraceae bacterium]|jgi:TonB family protein|nr:energy transducer TonB [Bryobacteraceae bacterium]
MRLHLLAAPTLLTCSLFAADSSLVSLAMPDSQFMAGVNVAQVMISPLGQHLAQTFWMPDQNLQKLLESAGFDPGRDLREILVSANGFTEGSSAIFLVRGTFDIPKILEAALAAGSSIETYKGVSIAQKSKGDAIALPDSTLAIEGDIAGLRAAIDRMAAPMAINSALAAQVNQLSATEDAWFVSIALLSQLLPQPAGASGAGPAPLAIFGKVQRASGGVKYGANVVVSLQAVSSTNEDAATLANTLRSFASAADLFIPKDNYVQAAALLQSVNVTADGPITKVSLSVPESQIEQMMQASHAKEPAPNGTDAPVRARPPGGPGDPLPSTGATPQRIRVNGNVEKAKLVQHAEPVYPPLALQARISGVVRLNAVIGKDGTVQHLTVSSGHPLLVPPAIEAVKQWVYAPTLLNGQAVEVVTQVEVEFKLNQ